jgi:hypothetical protein
MVVNANKEANTTIIATTERSAATTGCNPTGE